MNIKIEYKYIQSNIFTVSSAYLFKSFCHIFSGKRDCKKKFLPVGSLWLFFSSHSQWIGQLFKVGLKRTCPCTILPPLFKIFQIPPSGEGNQNLLPSPLKRGRGLNYGPTLANVFFVILKIFWKQMLENCPSHFKQIVYRQFVDDTFLLI